MPLPIHTSPQTLALMLAVQDPGCSELHPFAEAGVAVVRGNYFRLFTENVTDNLPLPNHSCSSYRFFPENWEYIPQFSILNSC